jgi:hypothetical protein
MALLLSDITNLTSVLLASEVQTSVPGISESLIQQC